MKRLVLIFLLAFTLIGCKKKENQVWVEVVGYDSVFEIKEGVEVERTFVWVQTLDEKNRFYIEVFLSSYETINYTFPKGFIYRVYERDLIEFIK